MIKKYYKRVVLGIGIVVILLATIFLYIKIQTSNYIFSPETLPQASTTAMILGASVMSNGNLSLILKDRADTAIELYNQKKISTILISGDSVNTNHNEVKYIEDYLIANNIPEKDITLDSRGVDTYQSMENAKSQFHLRKLVIITQSFHLPRALFIARHLGIEAYGISADKHKYSFYNYFREVFADVKAVWQIWIYSS